MASSPCASPCTHAHGYDHTRACMARAGVCERVHTSSSGDICCKRSGSSCRYRACHASSPHRQIMWKGMDTLDCTRCNSECSSQCNSECNSVEHSGMFPHSALFSVICAAVSATVSATTWNILKCFHTLHCSLSFVQQSVQQPVQQLMR